MKGVTSCVLNTKVCAYVHGTSLCVCVDFTAVLPSPSVRHMIYRLQKERDIIESGSNAEDSYCMLACCLPGKKLLKNPDSY